VPAFHWAYCFSEGLALVIWGSREWSFIDKSADSLIALDAVRKSWGKLLSVGDVDALMATGAYQFSEGVAAILSRAPGGSRWGYVDKDGNRVIRPAYLMAGPFRGGLAAVAVKPKKDPVQWGYIDHAGKMVIPPTFASAQSFSGGLALVSLEDGRQGYIDKSGKYVWQPSK
jgi:hypothetical protein